MVASLKAQAQQQAQDAVEARTPALQPVPPRDCASSGAATAEADMHSRKV